MATNACTRITSHNVPSFVPMCLNVLDLVHGYYGLIFVGTQRNSQTYIDGHKCMHTYN
ncbi:hypothetical protein DEO72_LG2g3616 [Vigna unguiculata]|uniref:Uncharacterized protein n=1 Tax=Vigna unguiculata TaxID=3917 RepID=A0A4D6L425_VIGUN|nr:hypothetical protein DEO72_LG2g3616 [Vigna unguiculata]